MSPTVVEASSVAEYLADCPYLECREDGHAWKRQHKHWLSEGSGKARIYFKRMQCRECGTLRLDERDWQFEFVRRTYTYPDGYLVKGVHVDRDAVCRWEIQRHTAVPEQRQPNSRRRRPASKAS
jgi:hypothetical protein